MSVLKPINDQRNFLFLGNQTRQRCQKRHLLLAFSILLTCCLFLIGCDNYSNIGVNIVKKAETELTNPGDWKLVSEFYSEPWSEVCFYPSVSIHGRIDQPSLANKLNIKGHKISTPYGLPSSTESHWVILFYIPPNVIHAFRIPNKRIFGGYHSVNAEEEYPKCSEREKAIFVMTEGSLKEQMYGKLLLSEIPKLNSLNQLQMEKLKHGR